MRLYAFLWYKMEMKKQDWIKQIKAIKKEIYLITDKDLAKTLLAESLINSIKTKVPKGKFGILFSGGVDSSTIALIAKKFNKNFICYCVGLEDCEDIKYAKQVAKFLKVKLNIKILTIDEVEKKLKELAKLYKLDAVKAGVGLVTLIAMEQAKKDKIKIVFTGLGSEEIFAGYQRHKESKDVNQECWNGLVNMYDRDLQRDLPIAKKLKMKIETPFLDKDLIKTAMGISSDLKITSENNKMILREVSFELGLGKFAFRKKRAAQYGSKFDKALEKLAKKNGFKFKKDYLNSL